MIHHLARAFFVRNAHSAANNPPGSGHQTPVAQPLRPVKARPITPWHVPSSEPAAPAPQTPSARPAQRSVTSPPFGTPIKPVAAHPVRISMDPLDRRRTVITGRFAEVCAALDRLVMEQEAAA